MAVTQLQKVIEQLGFSSKEAKVYLATLSLGECHVSDIAEKVKLPRTSVQAIIDKLYKESLMSFYIICRYKYWVAESPERLLANLRKRVDVVLDALPRLSALRKQGRKTDRKQDPSRSLGLLHMLANMSVQPVLITNGEVEIEYVNAAWEEQFGYSLEEVQGQNPHILKSGKTSPEIHKNIWKSLNADKIFQTDQIIDKRKDGTFFNLLTTIFQTRHNGNVFFVQILDDISEEKKVEMLNREFIQHEKQK